MTLAGAPEPSRIFRAPTIKFVPQGAYLEAMAFPAHIRLPAPPTKRAGDFRILSTEDARVVWERRNANFLESVDRLATSRKLSSFGLARPSGFLTSLRKSNEI